MRDATDYIYAQKLKKLRKLLNKKQCACYKELGLKNQQDLSALENGGKHFTQEIKLKICTFFNVSFSEFNALDNLSSFAQDTQIKAKESENSTQKENDLPILLLKRKLVEKELSIVKLKQSLVRGKKDFITKQHQDIPLYVLL